MKKLFIIIIFTLIAGLFISFTSKPAIAAGELTVDFHVPPGSPVFVVSNMLPGDSENRNIDITNNGAVTRDVWVKGVRTGGVGLDPKLETVLDIVIKDGLIPVYGTGSATGPKTVEDFFNDSAPVTGVPLGTIGPGVHKTYNFNVFFPHASGNEFQKKSVIFDLIFPNYSSDGDPLIINEVYYKVDSTHGLDSPKDRGIVGVNGNNVTIIISGNGAGSTNTVTVNQSQACNILQSNTTNVQTNVSSNSSTGRNSIIRNVVNSFISIVTGNAFSFVNIFTFGSTNTASLDCAKKLAQNDEWVELYNPNDFDVDLKNWTLADNNGTVTINENKIIKSKGYAILAKSNSTWNFWNEDPQATKIELGSQIGDGLDNLGDHLILKNPSNVEFDRMSWGSDTSGFTPPAINPVVATGSSTTRFPNGFDTNVAPDWKALNPPTPGN